jgi:hypothetical protein
MGAYQLKPWLFAVALMLLGHMPHAAAESLFQPSGRAEIAATDAMRSHSPGLLAHRFFKLDAPVFRQTLMPAALTGSVQARSGALRTLEAKLELPLAPGLTGIFERTHIAPTDEGGVEWFGNLAGTGAGSIVLVVENSRIIGQAQIGNRIFRINPADGGLYRVSEYDVTTFPTDIVRPVPTKPRAALDEEGNAEATPPVSIVVMPVYTKRARLAAVAAGTTITAEITLAFSLANAALMASNINARFVRSPQVAAPSSYDENTGTFNQSLDAISSGAAFAAIRTLRDTRKADLVALIRESGEYCGVAWLVANPSAFSSPFGFSVTARGCITNLTFAHEIGHNMGLNHDRFVVSNAPTGSFNYGFVNVAGRVRSIMAYRDRCTAAGVECARVNMFSTPLRKYEGKTIGTNFNDASRTLRRNMAAIAAYR